MRVEAENGDGDNRADEASRKHARRDVAGEKRNRDARDEQQRNRPKKVRHAEADTGSRTGAAGRRV